MEIVKKLRHFIRWFVPVGIIEHRRKIFAKRSGVYLVNILPITPENLGKNRMDFVYENEYIRASAVELIANEIYDKNIIGSVAELGVYKRDFARIINMAFHDRKLYLFDTFEGFDKRDITTELENKYSTGEQDFSETRIELLLAKMKNKKIVLLKKDIFQKLQME